jgi:hypothetical protein
MDHQARKFKFLLSRFQKAGRQIVNHQSGYLNLDVGEGRLPRQGVKEEFPQGDEQSIAEAISYVQKIAETYPDEFAQWAATSDILQKADSGASVRKATVNRSGQTQDPVSYPHNAISSTAGAGKTVLTSELKKLTNSAEELFQQHRMAEGHLKATNTAHFKIVNL